MTTQPLERVRTMLDLDRVPGQVRDDAGYLDLMEPDAPSTPTLSQRTMESPLLAPIYERWWRPILGKVLTGGLLGGGLLGDDEQADVVDRLAISGADRVLDVACGPGNFTTHFSDALSGDGIAIGVDVSTPMLAQAVRTNSRPRAAYLRADARTLPFADATFDATCCLAALYLVPEPYRVLDELVRVLAPGGRVAVLTSCASRFEPLARVQGLVGGVSGLRVFPRDAIPDVFHAAGLVDVEQRVGGLGQIVSARRP